MLFIVGAGRAGRALDAALAAIGQPALGLHGRRADLRPSTAPYSWGALPDAARRARGVIVAVGDRDLDAALAGLTGALGPGAIVLHVSGAADPAALAALRAADHPCGTFHPLVPLTGAAGAADVLRGAYIGIDGDDSARRLGETIAGSLGAHPVRIPPGEKPRYHAAAVFASNFPVVVAAEAERLLVDAGIAATDARGIVAGLLAGAAANVRAHGPAAALTGPATRGDRATIEAHLAALAGDADASAAYVALSRAAVALSGRRRA